MNTPCLARTEFKKSIKYSYVMFKETRKNRL